MISSNLAFRLLKEHKVIKGGGYLGYIETLIIDTVLVKKHDCLTFGITTFHRQLVSMFPDCPKIEPQFVSTLLKELTAAGYKCQREVDRFTITITY